jgi:hypothetical protein
MVDFPAHNKEDGFTIFSVINTEATKHNFSNEFVQCMKDNNNDTELCKQFL